MIKKMKSLFNNIRNMYFKTLNIILSTYSNFSHNINIFECTNILNISQNYITYFHHNKKKGLLSEFCINLISVFLRIQILSFINCRYLFLFIYLSLCSVTQVQCF